MEVGQERYTVMQEGLMGETGEWLGVEWDREGRRGESMKENTIV